MMRVVGAEALVVVGDDGLEGLLLRLGLVLVVLLLLRQVFLDLRTSALTSPGGEKTAGDVERDELGIGRLPFCLRLLEQCRSTRWRR